MHPRLIELLGYLDVERRHVLEVASLLPPERWSTRPAPERWSVSEVIWHLQRIERSIAKLIAKRVAEARADGHPAEVDDSSVLGALDGRGVANRSVPIPVPTPLSPPEIPDAASVQQQLNESRVLLREAIASADGLALGSIRHPHPVLGEIDLYQWILFVGQHERRHADQIAEAASAVAAS